tara:strand:+ start:273 stop:803 length:531 start_codon:yes stop_codon:yes gene_type:complete
MARIIVKLSNKEVSFAEKLAHKRDAKKVRFGAGKYAACSEKTGSSEMSHFYGILGEVAVAKHFGAEVDEEIFDNHGDDGIDLTIKKLKGKTQVKTTTYCKEPLLRVPMGRDKDKEKIENVESFVCCCIDPKVKQVVEIVGWATREEVKKGAQRKFLRFGPTNYVLGENELRPLPKT